MLWIILGVILWLYILTVYVVRQIWKIRVDMRIELKRLIDREKDCNYIQNERLKCIEDKLFMLLYKQAMEHDNKD